MPEPATPADVLGVPRLPPARVTAAANALRDRIGRLHRSMAPPPVAILESLFGILDHGALVALCRAGVPEALTRPMTVAELATSLDGDADQLGRLVRFASTRGWVRIDRRGRVRPSRTTPFLRRDHPGGWRAWVEFAGAPEVAAAVGRLHIGQVGSPADAFADANGAPFFEWMAEHPDRWTDFDGAMAAGGRMHGLVLAETLDWSGAATVCDVGGGTGALLATLLDHHHHLRGTVFDLPGVVERSVSHERLAAVGGDAFVSVPAGFDVYLLVNVLHDWGDQDAVRMLRSVAAVATQATRVVVLDNEHRAVPRNDLATNADILMAALTGGGRERDAAAFAALASAAGLRLTETTPLASGDLAHELRLM